MRGAFMRSLLHLAVLFILVFPVLTCELYSSPPPPSPGDDDEITWTNVVYSPDGKSLTLYLEGSVPVTKGQSRALSRELAIAGHDYFEVVFYYRGTTSATDKIVRTSWELYKDARITGVYGKTAGEGNINYGYTSVSGTGAAPANGTSGAAILFVGRKTDKTLLAVGRLAQVNGANNTTITPATTTVTFDVVALDCGVKTGVAPVYDGDPGTSFITDFRVAGTVSPASTQVVENYVMYDGRRFRMFKLRGGGDTLAEYYFRTVGTTVNTRMNAFVSGIIVAADYVPDNDPADSPYGKKQPRYPTADGKFQYYSVKLDKETTITPRNNKVRGAAFVNPVQVTFNTAMTVPGSMFAFVFEVPVSPLSLSADAWGTEAGMWYIRPSYDSYRLDLDDGGTTGSTINGAGGAVLISTGENEEMSGYKIRVVIPPNKFLYPYANGTPSQPADTNNRYFNVRGLLVALEYADGGALIRYLDIDELAFEIGMREVTPRSGPLGDGPTAGFLFTQELYSVQTIKINYYHSSGAILSDEFLIILDNAGGLYSATSFALASHRYATETQSPEVNKSSFMSNTFFKVGPGAFVVVATESFNFINTAHNQEEDNPKFVIFVASKPGNDGVNYDETYDTGGANNVVLGRGGNNSTPAIVSWGSVNAYYFGIWPFNTPLVVGGTTYTYEQRIYVPPGQTTTYRTRYMTYPFVINAAGQNTFTGAPGYTAAAGLDTPGTHFITNGQGGRVYNVKRDEGITVRYEDYGPNHLNYFY
jgi:hypothetical protein